MASVQPLLLVWFRGEGWREKRRFFPLLLSSAGKPVDEANVGDLRVAKFHEMDDDLLPFFLPWALIPVVKIVCGHCHLPSQMKGLM